MNILRSNLPEFIYLLFLIPIGLIPNYGALDRIATQWLYLSVLNSLGLVFFLYSKNYNQISFIKIFSFKPFVFLILFTFWGILSFFYAINPIEVIVKWVRWIQLPISLMLLIIIFNRNQIDYVKIISIILSSVLLVELYFSYSTYFDLTKFINYDFSYAYLIKGATGNKNINAASVLIKTPFLIFLIFRLKPVIIKILLALILVFSFYLIFILSARAAIISLVLISIIFTLQYFIYLKKSKYSFKSISHNIVMLSFLFPILLFSFKYSNQSSVSVISRVSTINNEDESTQQRLRYYKHSLNQLLENPIFGTGLGNWKIKSVDYDKLNIQGYVIPYHTHNDFLEIAAELGIIGLTFYILIFLFPFVSILNPKLIYKSFNIDSIILYSGIIYIIDACLNFPHARPVMQIPFVIILIFSYYYKSLKLKKND